MAVPREQTQAKYDLLSSGVMKQTPEQTYTVADRFEEIAHDKGDNVFLISGDEKITYAELNRQANRYAHVALKLGVKRGEVGAVMIENRPAFFYAWLGLAKIGAIAALINTQAKDKALQHMLEVAGAKVLFLGAECAGLYHDAGVAIPNMHTLIVDDGTLASNLPRGTESLTPHLADADDSNPPAALREGVIGEHPFWYVYTSGTTGLPKAAIISHMRWLGVGDGWKAMLGITESDVFYCFLPLFHGAAGMSLVSNAASAAAAIVLKRKFSASQFWPDVRQHKVTTLQYIGEVIRYLVNRPVEPDEKHHTLKRMTGAGMTRDVWTRFEERFGNVEIYEGWGATESNCNMINVDNVKGACGRLPYKDRTNARLVRFDVEAEDYVRDANGHLVECEPGEVGELIGMVLKLEGIGAGRFEGYTDPVATEKKIMRNVFAEGDAWYRSGDLFTRDADDYYYFVDRIGDTFRWKSENVSTTEVAEVLSAYEPAELVNVYGVKVPAHEGRAGMASIQLKAGSAFDAKALYELCVEKLPHYAVPLFVRVSEQADITVTFKLRKVDLKKQGYDPEAFNDPLYVLSHPEKTYVPYSAGALKQLGVAPFQPE